MKGVKIQIRVEPETKERWQGLARKEGVTLTQYIVERVEGAVGKSAKVGARKVDRVVLKGLPKQEDGGFITYFK